MNIVLRTGEQIDLPSETATIQFGMLCAEQLRGHWFLALHGDLGAGKTTFVRGLAAGLGCVDSVSSPTFAIIQTYTGTQSLVHCDWYRLEHESELDSIGWDEFVDQNPFIALEWADRFPSRLPATAKHLQFEIIDDRRVVTFGRGW